MKMVKDKKVLVGADFAGVPLKNAVVAHLEKNGSGGHRHRREIRG